MMTIVISVLLIFLAVFFLVGGLGLLSVIIAHVVGRIVPRASEACSRCISGWSTKRGFRNRLLLAHLGITFVILAVFVVVGLPNTLYVRSKITESTRLVVRSGGNCCRDLERERVLFETEDVDAINRFAQQVSLAWSLSRGHCMCCGDVTFDLYQGQEIHYSFSLHHGQRIRIKGSSFGDKELSSSSRRRLKEWLTQMGVTKALKELQEQEEQKMRAEMETVENSAQQGAEGDG